MAIDEQESAIKPWMSHSWKHLIALPGVFESCFQTIRKNFALT